MSLLMNRFLGAVLVLCLAGTPDLCSAMTANENLPDNPGAVASQQASQGNVPANANAQNAQPSPEQAPPDNSQNAPAEPQQNSQQNGSAPANGSQTSNTGQQPVGGAAAQLGRTTGGAASKPAGAALAPTKQRQTRSLVLKLGLIAGAGIAVGSVAALAHGSPSRPPGAH
jgi:hypothetical protein